MSGYAVVVHNSSDKATPWSAYCAVVVVGTIERYSPMSTNIRVYRPTARWAWRAADRQRRKIVRREDRRAQRTAVARRVTGYTP